MTLFQLYLFMVILPNIHYLAAGPGFGIPLSLIGTASVVGYIISLLAEEDVAKNLKEPCVKGIKWVIFGIITLSAIFAFSPSNEQLYTMAGGYAATNTKDIAKLPDNVVKAANAWLEKAAKAAESDKATSQK